MQAIRRFVSVTFLWVLLLPVALIILGAASNQAAVIANGGAMPVMVNKAVLARFAAERQMAQAEADAAGEPIAPMPEGMLDSRHSVMTPETHLKALCDVFNLDGIESIGDLTIELGAWMYTFCPFVWGVLICLKLYSLD